MALTVVIYSDVICPWCYLGERRVKKAIESLDTDLDVVTRYLPYELNSATPSEGVDRKKYLEEKYGDAIEKAHQRLKSLGPEAGIAYNFETIDRIPNTFKAHRLIWWAGEKGVQEKVVNGLFKAYFTDGVDIGDEKELVKVSGRWGLDPLEVGAFLKSTKGLVEVRHLEEQGYQMGITGVPFFIFDGSEVVAGAQEVKTFKTLLESMAASF